jgi:16S rRNA G966 N2-methylase RsmD
LDYVKKYKGKPYDIILIDPPFPLKICSSILTEISESDVASPDSEIIIEHSRHEPLEDHVGRLRSVDSRSYGDKLVTFYKKEG